MVDPDSAVVGTLLVFVAVFVVGLLFLGPVGWLLATGIVVATQLRALRGPEPDRW